jgi:hypothetical protein
MQAVMAILLMTRDGIRIRREAGGASWSVPAERDAIKYRGEVVSLLAAWRTKVSFSSDGTYSLSAIATGFDGLVLETRLRRSDLVRDRVAFASIFGPAPRYLAGLALMGLALFGLLYLPYAIRRLARRRSAGVTPTR